MHSLRRGSQRVTKLRGQLLRAMCKTRSRLELRVLSASFSHHQLYVLQVTGICGSRSDLADYSNKQWGGLISGFYSPRQQCYVEIVAKKGLPVVTNDTDYNICIDKVGWDFQHDFGGQKFPVCGPAVVGDAVKLSRRLITKYPTVPPVSPPSASKPRRSG